MALSDCPRCWDTPCTCGYMGYTITKTPGPSPYEVDQLKARIKELESQLAEKNRSTPAPQGDVRGAIARAEKIANDVLGRKRQKASS